MKAILLAMWALFLLPTLALAQGPVSVCYLIGNNNCVPAIQSVASIKVDVSTGTTTELVALATGKKIYVTSFNLYAGGTGTAKFVYGTGSACGTGTVDLTGAYPMKDQGNISVGSGLGTSLFVPVSNALCITTSASVQISGSIGYVQF